MTSIGEQAFEECRGLSSITIPNSVTNIGNYAFYIYSNLTSVISEIKNPFEIKEDVFSSDTYSKASLTVPNGSKAKYQSTSSWSKFSKIEEASGGDTSTKRTIHVATAGTLPNLIPESEKYIVEELTLTGELNGTDFRLLRDMAGCNYLGEETSGKLKVLDFSGAKIVAGGEKYVDTDHLGYWTGSFHYTVDKNNELPQCVFHGCKYTSVTIPNTVTIIDIYAFRGCSGLTSITIPNSVTSIGEQAFYNCSALSSITIPNSVTSIGDAAFSGCDGLSSIKVDSNNRKYDSRNNCNAIIETSSNTLITGCKSTLIPSFVTSIGYRAFYGCSGLTSITIPNSVISIGNNAFSGCSGLTSITIPNSVTSIGEAAFSQCYGLTSITIPNSVTRIGYLTFSNCSGLSSITIPNSVTSIGDAAFSGCSGLTSIMIPNSVTSIGNGAFFCCSSLTSITIPNSVTSIGEQAFEECRGLTSITIPNSVTIISGYAFSNCSGLTSITIPNSVTIIDIYAFRGCSGLTSITIPNSVTSIGSHAFESCSSLTSVVSEIQNPFDIEENVFSSSTYTKASLTVPNGSKSRYLSTNYWNKFQTITEMDGQSYTLEITASGYGYASYNGTSIRNSTRTFNVNEGESATINFNQQQ